MSKIPTVDTEHSEYEKMCSKWELIDDLYGGTASMLKAGRKYLPQRPQEADEVYNERLENSTLLNVVRWAVKTLSSKPFSEPISVGETTTEELKSFVYDVTGDSESLQTFGLKFFQTALKYGKAHALVEFPEIPQGLTQAQEEALNARPYFVEICPKALFNWKIERIGGVDKLTQIRIHEHGTITSEWGDIKVPQIRVIDVNRERIYRKTSESLDQFVLVSEKLRSTPFDFIPLVTLYTGFVKPMCAIPPLEDLSYLNMKHWRKQSNLDYIESAQFPILFGKNLTSDPESPNAALPLGVMMMVHSSMHDASLEIVEPSGSSIDALRSSIEHLEDLMAASSSQLLSKRTGNETATGRAIDTAEASSELQAMVRNLEDALETALEYAGMWMGLKSPNADLIINDEFGSELTSSDIADLLSARKDREISHKTFINESKRRGFLAETVEAAQETKELTLEASDSSTGDITNA